MKKIMLLPFFIALLLCFKSNAQSTTLFDNLISNTGGDKTLTFNIHNNTKPGSAFRLRSNYGSSYGYLTLEFQNNGGGTWNNAITFNRSSVGIGVDLFSMPTGYNLYVANGILTEKVKVALKSSSDWADYVFDDDYELMSLKDVEKFIKENKHLPGISSAETLVEEGIDLVAMQAKLLEKIEELTLYLIQKDKEIEELKTQVKSLIEQK